MIKFFSFVFGDSYKFVMNYKLQENNDMFELNALMQISTFDNVRIDFNELDIETTHLITFFDIIRKNFNRISITNLFLTFDHIKLMYGDNHLNENVCDIDNAHEYTKIIHFDGIITDDNDEDIRNIIYKLQSVFSNSLLVLDHCDFHSSLNFQLFNDQWLSAFGNVEQIYDTDWVDWDFWYDEGQGGDSLTQKLHDRQKCTSYHIISHY